MLFFFIVIVFKTKPRPLQLKAQQDALIYYYY